MFVAFMMTTGEPENVVTSHTNQAQKLMSVTTASLTGDAVIFPIVCDIFELRRKLEARARLDAAFVLCFVCLLS